MLAMPAAWPVLLFALFATARAGPGPDPGDWPAVRHDLGGLRSGEPASLPGIACSRPIHVARRLRGAYFRKVESLPDALAVGIRGRLVLPQVSFDDDRDFSPAPGQPGFWEGPLDRPSVYLGAHTAAKEVDAGLVWDRVYDAEGRPTYTDLAGGSDGRDPRHRLLAAQAAGQKLRPNFAFRPYWRTTSGSGNQWHNPPAGDPRYFYPGETVVMTLRVRPDGTLRLDMRAEGGGGLFTAVFRQDGFDAGQARSFKRVVSIDQFRVSAGARRGNEGSDAQPTRARVRGARWLKVSVLGEARSVFLSGKLCQEVAGSDTSPRYGDIFAVRPLPEGGEDLDITPPGPSTP